MNKRSKLGVLTVLLVLVAGLITNFLLNAQLDVLNPAGEIATKERNLIVITALLALIVVVPVFALTGYIVWKFREGKDSKYTPDWDRSPVLETIWWGLPMAIITILAVITWNSSHQLDPYRPLASDKAPLNVQVIALDWKWLFIYPDEKIATVNYLRIPINRPVNFAITSDAPMNSFWVPRLGGQIYAMSGMSTQLHLMADQTGVFNGSSANISGRGFAGMNFKVQAVNQNQFDNWADLVRASPDNLSFAEYSKLARPSENNKVVIYAEPADNLYDSVVTQYMGVGHSLADQTYNSEGAGHAHSY